MVSLAWSPSLAAATDLPHVSIADTNRFGNLELHRIPGWVFSFDAPTRGNYAPTHGHNAQIHASDTPTLGHDTQIREHNTPVLTNTLPIPGMHNFTEVLTSAAWSNYGWFELTFTADSTIAGVPLILSYRSQEAITLWLNGKRTLQAGTPSPNPQHEILSRFINPIQVGVMLREGPNHILIELSSHTIRPIHASRRVFNNGIDLVLAQHYEPFQRRERAFIFGGTVLLLLNLVIIHLFLGYRFRGTYHLHVALSTFFMMLHAFATMSDTLFNWTYAYMYFYMYTYALAYILVVYFFILSIRKYYALSIHYRALNTLLAASFLIAIALANYDFQVLGYFHLSIIAATVLYGGFSLYQAKKLSNTVSVAIIAGGLALTMLGTFLYVGVYLIFNLSVNWLFYLSTILSYTSIPIALTLVVASSYARLINTLEEKVKNRTLQLEAANEFQKRFFANISHEYQTPLTIAQGLLHRLMQTLPPDAPVYGHLVPIRRNIERLASMVREVLELSKSDNTELTLHKRHYRAETLVRLSVEAFRSLAEMKHVALHYHSDAPDAVLHADREKLEIILNNLLSNAIKFNQKNGHVRVRTSLDGPHFLFSVEDTGIGISESERELIFQRFHRIKQNSERYVEGMGIGLELSQTLARLHEGEIRLDTTYTNGARFVLRLPVSEATLADVEQDARVAPSAGTSAVPALDPGSAKSDWTILLVEDNDDMATYVGEVLSEVGHVHRVENGSKALEVLATLKPDLMVTDLMMPEMSGEKLIAHLSEHPKWKQLPVIVLTARAADLERNALMRIGVVDFITKPFDPEQLVLRARNLLRLLQNRKAVHVTLSSDEITPSAQFVEKATQFVRQRLGDATLSVSDLADHLAQSRSTFNRNLQNETGMSPAEFIREIRLMAAHAMIQSSRQYRVEEVARAVGYKSASTFRKLYRERFGDFG
jgi:signal transduction histidine kinase/DNA-binding response OmpR family regulator